MVAVLVTMTTPPSNAITTWFSPINQLRDSYPSISHQNLYYFTPPNVNTVVIYGHGIPTPAKILFNCDFVKNEEGVVDATTLLPIVVFGDGDGSVNTRSPLRGQAVWGGGSGGGSSNNGGKSIRTIGFKGVNHMALLFDVEVYQVITEVVTSDIGDSGSGNSDRSAADVSESGSVGHLRRQW